MLKKFLLVAAAVLAVAVVVPTTSSAVTVPTSYSATTSITNRGDSGGGTGIWARDTMTRKLTISVKSTAPDGTITYTASVRDSGTFTAVLGADTPNQSGTHAGDKVTHVVTGAVTGYAGYDFTASRLPSMSAVPVHVSGTPASTALSSTGSWYKQAFPAGTVFGGAGLNPTTWIWTYVYDQTVKVGSVSVSLPEYWVDSASTGGGQSTTAGNVDGSLIVS